MKSKIIGGGIGALVGRVIGGIGIAAMGGAIGIPAVVVTAAGAVGGAVVGNQVGKFFDDDKK